MKMFPSGTNISRRTIRRRFPFCFLVPNRIEPYVLMEIVIWPLSGVDGINKESTHLMDMILSECFRCFGLTYAVTGRFQHMIDQNSITFGWVI